MFHRLRDEELQWPWHDGSPEARRGGENLDAGALYRRLVASLMQLEHYGDAGCVALQVDPVPLLRSLPQPIRFIAREGDPYYAEVPAALALARAGSSSELPGE